MSRQTDAKPSEARVSPPRGFDPFVKDHALKILMDYSGSTKRKWTTIRKEILSVASVQPSERAPLLTRQDLESWARGDSVLGDDKFRLVFEFLTHPTTLARPEFAHATILMEPFHRLLRVGRALAEFYSDFANSSWIGRPQPFGAARAEPAAIETRAAAICGTFVGVYRGQSVCLSLERIGSESFFVAHYLASPGNLESWDSDWNLDRYSGYATVGGNFTVHLKGVLVSLTRTLGLLLPREQEQPQYIDVISDEIMHKASETIFWSNMEYTKKRLPYINPFDYSFRLSRSNSEALSNLIDVVRWRVPS
jgi:hypothetical protein